VNGKVVGAPPTFRANSEIWPVPLPPELKPAPTLGELQEPVAHTLDVTANNELPTGMCVTGVENGQAELGSQAIPVPISVVTLSRGKPEISQACPNQVPPKPCKRIVSLDPETVTSEVHIDTNSVYPFGSQPVVERCSTKTFPSVSLREPLIGAQVRRYEVAATTRVSPAVTGEAREMFAVTVVACWTRTGEALTLGAETITARTPNIKRLMRPAVKIL
jgi:hypothetical protein